MCCLPATLTAEQTDDDNVYFIRDEHGLVVAPTGLVVASTVGECVQMSENPWWHPTQDDLDWDEPLPGVIVVTLEYGAELPLWGEGWGNIDWRFTKFSPELLDRLAAWQRAFDENYDYETGWRSDAAKDRWAHDANDLATDLRVALGTRAELVVNLWPLGDIEPPGFLGGVLPCLPAPKMGVVRRAEAHPAFLLPDELGARSSSPRRVVQEAMQLPQLGHPVADAGVTAVVVAEVSQQLGLGHGFLSTAHGTAIYRQLGPGPTPLGGGVGPAQLPSPMTSATSSGWQAPWIPPSRVYKAMAAETSVDPQSGLFPSPGPSAGWLHPVGRAVAPNPQ
jgi:hypothetical protein